MSVDVDIATWRKLLEIGQPFVLTKTPATELLDEIERLRAGGMTFCSGCGREIDPETCGCGEGRHDYDSNTGHPFVPMGCSCLRGGRPDSTVVAKSEIERLRQFLDAHLQFEDAPTPDNARLLKDMADLCRAHRDARAKAGG